MTGTSGLSRRSILGATLATPVVLRHARGDEPIKIGMPVALTGPGGEIGAQMRRGAEYWAKTVNAKGGVLGRQI
jgi:branched-chain amino acid transport system substrate-binding protein